MLSDIQGAIGLVDTAPVTEHVSYCLTFTSSMPHEALLIVQVNYHVAS